MAAGDLVEFIHPAGRYTEAELALAFRIAGAFRAAFGHVKLLLVIEPNGGA